MEMIFNRLQKNYKRLKKWANRLELEAYRLYDRDIPEYPYIVDLYGDSVVVFERIHWEIDANKSEHKEHLLLALEQLFSIKRDKIIYKERQRQSGTEQYTKLSRTNKRLEIKEHQAKFLVNLHDYLDTGLFLDHRPLRQIIFKEAADKTVLNLFSYTGSISVMAALGGGTVTSVDMSGTYMEWAKDNFKLNGIDLAKHYFVQDNALEYLAHEQSEFDLIVLDPPTFSNSKRMEETFDVERDQLYLIHLTMGLLAQSGVLYFSTNKRKFKLHKEIEERYNVVDISKRTIPEDFHDQSIHSCYKITKK